MLLYALGSLLATYVLYVLGSSIIYFRQMVAFEEISNSPYAKTLFLRKFISSFIEAILAATNNLYLMAK